MTDGCADCREEICHYGCLRDLERMIRGLAFHILRNPNDLDDVSQEVLIKTLQSLPAFRGGSFRAYVGRIARNHCYDLLRSRRRIQAESQVFDLESAASPLPGPDEVAVQREEFAEISRLVQDLKPVEREILLLRHVHQMSFQEIADVIGMREGTIRTKLFRARQKITAAWDHSQKRQRDLGMWAESGTDKGEGVTR